MKRDFLKNLGIEDKELIDKILDENSADIGRAKGELETYKSKVTDLEGQIVDKDKQITALTSESKNVEDLREKVSQLETEKTNLTNELNTKLSDIQKTHSIENKIRDEKGKNVKAIMALLDMEKITFENNQLGGIEDQLTQLKEAEDSSMLFGEVASPSGTNPSNPPSNGGNAPTSKTLAEAVAKALSK